MNLAYFWVALGGALGSVSRYWLSGVVAEGIGGTFPWGTLVVNVTGSLILGLLTGAAAAGHASPHVQLLLGTGLCGALTTYSTFSYETLRLTETGAGFYAAANVVAGVMAGLGAAFAGVSLAQALWA